MVSASGYGPELIDCTSELFVCVHQQDCLSQRVWSGMEDDIRGYFRGIAFTSIAHDFKEVDIAYAG